MAIKETNQEIKITLSKEQAKWLDKASKKLNMTKSKFIAYLLSKKSQELATIYKLKSNKMNDAEMAKLFEICHTPWLDD